MKDYQKQAIVVGFDKSNGSGIRTEVASTIVTGGSAGVIIGRKKKIAVIIPERGRETRVKGVRYS